MHSTPTWPSGIRRRACGRDASWEMPREREHVEMSSGGNVHVVINGVVKVYIRVEA